MKGHFLSGVLTRRICKSVNLGAERILRKASVLDLGAGQWVKAMRSVPAVPRR
ncbi:hypothetical protein R69658_07891 [Paraburkholderia aspalathi]|uniref:Transposase n=1 Tax=Paraburkholderia aspalathi TaxID=1324617 RepID=A0ABM8T847_9BURK|nr:hypothetical protein R69658_07891 [Paraburkholderia aspalathi]